MASRRARRRRERRRTVATEEDRVLSALHGIAQSPARRISTVYKYRECWGTDWREFFARRERR